MKPMITGVALAAALGLTAGSAVFAQPPAGAPAAAPAGPTPALIAARARQALSELPARGGAKLTVTTPAWAPGGDIPFTNTQYQGNIFPGLTWTAGPAGIQSYAIIMQDTDGAMQGAPILHWTMYNIPASVRSLPAGMAADANPAGSAYGRNYQGAAPRPYLGPRTPPGPKHAYHMQVFALDMTLTAEQGASYDTMAAAMKDHVLASGEVVGMGQADPNAPARGGGGRGGGGAAPAATAPAPAPK